jgi:Protein of unknown function (DUF1579)
MSYPKLVLTITALASCALVATALVPALQDMPILKPTEQHKKILSGVGEWEGTLTSYMTPDQKPATSPAHESVTPIGEFWVLSQFDCQFNGMPYHGSGHVGYDPEKKKYIGTWVDSMSSLFALMEGDIDPATKALVMHWQGRDMTGKVVPHRSESVENGDTRTMTFYMGEGAGTKSMVIEMKRKKGKTTETGATK